ncbi:MAG: MBL fold metallo-hydrolase [Gammaproteobacteria bacterium]|nr:MBL fold metallo-hydrolase [Gammaproteobacteria bacterium]
MKVTVIPVTAFQQNCSVLRCEGSGRGAVVDPGGELERILEIIHRERVEVERILVTHGHADHAGAVADLSEYLGVPVEGPHRDDLFLVTAMAEQARQFGLAACRPFTPDRWLVHGDTVAVGETTLQVLHCPGHTPGHVVFFDAADGFAVSGDVIFKGSIGRTDFPRGDFATLLSSIRERLFPLGDDVTFLPGHGPVSTFGDERRSNPFVGDAAVAGSVP